MKGNFFLLLAAIFSLGTILYGCASSPEYNHERYSFSLGENAADTAKSMLGKPYRYNGENPSGFDCSGLVRYSYLSAGLDVPHSTHDLKQQSKAIRSRDLRKGDLLFFNEEAKKSSHVGIYVGDNRFVHAPSTGKKVRIDSLADPYWKRHFVEARRFY